MKHNSSSELKTPPKRAARALLTAGMTAALLSSCAEDTAVTSRTVPAVEIERARVEDHAARVQLAKLSIVNSPAYEQAHDPSLSMREKIAATYQSIKGYVDYADANNIPLAVGISDYQVGGYYACAIKKIDADTYSFMVSASDSFGRFSADVFISPTHVGVFGEHQGRSFDLASDRTGDDLLSDVNFELWMVQEQLQKGECSIVEGYSAAGRFFEYVSPAVTSGGGSDAGSM